MGSYDVYDGAKADDAGPLGSAVAAAAAAAKAAGADAKGDSKRVLPETARRELARLRWLAH